MTSKVRVLVRKGDLVVTDGYKRTTFSDEYFGFLEDIMRERGYAKRRIENAKIDVDGYEVV